METGFNKTNTKVLGTISAVVGVLTISGLLPMSDDSLLNGLLGAMYLVVGIWLVTWNLRQIKRARKVQSAREYQEWLDSLTDEEYDRYMREQELAELRVLKGAMVYTAVKSGETCTKVRDINRRLR